MLLTLARSEHSDSSPLPCQETTLQPRLHILPASNSPAGPRRRPRLIPLRQRHPPRVPLPRSVILPTHSLQPQLTSPPHRPHPLPRRSHPASRPALPRRRHPLPLRALGHAARAARLAHLHRPRELLLPPLPARRPAARGAPPRRAARPRARRHRRRQAGGQPGAGAQGRARPVDARRRELAGAVGRGRGEHGEPVGGQGGAAGAGGSGGGESGVAEGARRGVGVVVAVVGCEG